MFFRFSYFVIMLLLALLFGTSANAQSVPYHYYSTSSDNSTLVSKNISGTIQSVHTISAISTSATVYYLKLYDKATAPACGTDTVVATFPLPASTSGAGFMLTLSDGMLFAKGIGFCIVANQVDSDDTSAAAGITVDFTYNTH